MRGVYCGTGHLSVFLACTKEAAFVSRCHGATITIQLKAPALVAPFLSFAFFTAFVLDSSVSDVSISCGLSLAFRVARKKPALLCAEHGVNLGTIHRKYT